MQWKHVLEFMLQDESSDDEILEVKSLEPLKLIDEEDEDLVENVILGLQAIREQPMKVLSDVEKLKWYSVTWPSSLAEMFRLSRDIEKIKTKQIVDAFRATESMLPPIPSPRIVQIEEGSPTEILDNLHDEPLIHPFEFFITESGQQIILSFSGTMKIYKT